MAQEAVGVKRYVVRLTGEERAHLEAMLRKGKQPPRRGDVPGRCWDIGLDRIARRSLRRMLRDQRLGHGAHGSRGSAHSEGLCDVRRS
jgi:hypothetical protein